jgi:phenylalanyl-tRNA synthetase alpha chain
VQEFSYLNFVYLKVQDTLKRFAEEGTASLDAPTMTEYKKRKLLVQNAVNFMFIRRASGFTTTIEKQETELTPEMIASGDWKNKKFKAYNFDALGSPIPLGHLHPLMKVYIKIYYVLILYK